MGNLHSVRKALEWVGAETQIVTDAAGIEGADKVILPGVGGFADAINTLREKRLIEPLKQAVRQGKPFLGICLGLQLLFEVSYEAGEHAGLGLIAGKVVKFDFAGREDAQKLKIPHMGWNSLHLARDVALYHGIEEGSYVYFVHSYYVVPQDQSVIASTTEHGGEFVSSIARDNLYATQFHPEKSQRVGLAMLKNFAAL